MDDFRDWWIAAFGSGNTVWPEKGSKEYDQRHQEQYKLVGGSIIGELRMELNFPEHWGDCFAVDCKEDPNECNDVAVNLISGDFHIVDVVIDNTNKHRPDGANSMYDIQREVELSPCKNGSVKWENQAPEE